MIQTEVKIYESLAKAEVKQAKLFVNFGIANDYLLNCIYGLREIISHENPYAPATSDMRYRTFVIKILIEHKKQELPNYGEFMAKVLLGKWNQ